ncbi:hypothetical protein [Xanthomonas sp. BRIP62415]|uniref:hypothetical protein n=1 Tax=Xanthomonas sp. BRIP62415 TaxID=2182390 RepID=UPI000F8F412E|nr:hypothetical protein [Xanthomonas sp. BRIP62415]
MSIQDICRTAEPSAPMGMGAKAHHWRLTNMRDTAGAAIQIAPAFFWRIQFDGGRRCEHDDVLGSAKARPTADTFHRHKECFIPLRNDHFAVEASPIFGVMSFSNH